jgi:ABC-type antimicrobial peptide transport system permease subunit
VQRRTPEIGIRMALGAAPSQVRRSVLIRTSIPLGVGLTIGLAAAWTLSIVLARFLFEVRPHDPWIYLGAGAALAASGLAAFVPARRASRVDPAITLRAM